MKNICNKKHSGKLKGKKIYKIKIISVSLDHVVYTIHNAPLSYLNLYFTCHLNNKLDFTLVHIPYKYEINVWEEKRLKEDPYE